MKPVLERFRALGKLEVYCGDVTINFEDPFTTTKPQVAIYCPKESETVPSLIFVPATIPQPEAIVGFMVFTCVVQGSYLEGKYSGSRFLKKGEPKDKSQKLPSAEELSNLANDMLKD